jgi:phosphatidylinositol alpha-1,6-mannosyltransferase
MVQTIASPPRSFEQPGRLLFGDVVVAQSHWTRRQFERAFAATGERLAIPIEVIAPCAPSIESPTEERKRFVRASLGLNDTVPILVYPGDLEVSHGAEWVAEAVPALLTKLRDFCVVFAYRNKSAAAAPRAEQLRAQLPNENVRFVAEVPDIHALLATATGILFPVDDLYGKVDIPIVLLEAMQLGTPVVSLDSGPLADLQGVLHVSAGDIPALVQYASRLVGDLAFRQASIAAQHEAIERNHRPAQVAGRYEAIYDALLKRVGGLENGPNCSANA